MKYILFNLFVSVFVVISLVLNVVMGIIIFDALGVNGIFFIMVPSMIISVWGVMGMLDDVANKLDIYND